MTNVPYTGRRKTEGSLGTWSHCGSARLHSAHRHSTASLEGAYDNVQCLGTSLADLQARAAQALSDYAGPNARKFNELARAYGARQEDIDAVLEGEVVPVVSRMTRKDVLRAQLADMQRELAELERFPTDNFEVGTIVAFDKQFSDSDQVFHYAAIKGTQTHWYLSGLISGLLNTPVDRNGARHRVNWEALTYLMRDALNVRVIFKTDGHDLVGSSAESDYEVVKPRSRTLGVSEPSEETYDSEPEVRTPVRDPSRS